MLSSGGFWEKRHHVEGKSALEKERRAQAGSWRAPPHPVRPLCAGLRQG